MSLVNFSISVRSVYINIINYSGSELAETKCNEKKRTCIQIETIVTKDYIL